MENLNHLVFLFENFIEVNETRDAYASYLESEKCAQLLYFYEQVSSFLRQLKNQSKSESVSPDSSLRSGHASPVITPSSPIASPIKKGRFARSPSISQSTVGTDVYYELEILVRDFLDSSGKQFISQFEILRKTMINTIKERKTKSYDEFDFDNDEFVFYSLAFQDFTNCVFNKLKNDLFPIYIQSEPFLEFLQKMKEEDRTILLNKVAKHKDTELVNILYTEDELYHELLCERDFMFAFQLVHDKSSMWNPIFNGDERDETRSSVFHSSLDFIKSSSSHKLMMLKYMGYLPFHVDDCAKMFISGSYPKNIDPSVRYSQFVQFIQPNSQIENQKEFLQRQVPSTIHYNVISLNPLLTKRDMLANTSIRYFPHLEEYLLVSKSITHELVPEKKHPIRIKFLFGISFERIASNETRFTFVSYTSLGGWLTKLGKERIKVAAKRSKAYIENSIKAIEEAMTQSKTLEEYLKDPIEQTLSLPQTLQHNMNQISDWKPLYKGFSNRNLFDLKMKKEPKRCLSVRL